MAPPVIRRITRKITLGTGGSIDLNFSDGSFSYLGSTVETVFNEILLVNFTNGDIFYSLETDPADAITVDGTATEGVVLVARQTGVSEVNSQISRLRITTIQGGDIYIILYNNPRSLL